MLAPKCLTYNGRPTFANPRYLKKAQSEKPCLYEIPYDTSDLANRFAPNREETMTLANENPLRQNLPQNRKQAEIHSNVLKPGMYRISTTTTQSRTPQLPHASRNTNPHVSKSTGVNHYTSVSRPQLKCYQVKDKVVPNNSQVKFNHKEVEEHHRISSISRKTKSVTACNLQSKSRTLITKKPKVVPISASKPKRKANKSVATPHKKTVASDTTIQKSKSYYKELYENTNQEWKWWIAKKCPSGYKWTQKPHRTKKIWMPKIRKEDVSTSISPTIDIVSRITNIVQLILFIVDSGCTKHMTGNLKLLCNFVEKFLGTVHFGNDQFALILGYGDLNQGNVTIKWVYYVECLNHNLFSVGQFCDADLEDETPEVLKDFLTMIQCNLQAQVIIVCTDRGTEFLNKTLHVYFKEEGIEHQTSTPRTPEQNGVIKRWNRTLVEAARAMLSASKLPLSFWAKAVATTCYTQNRSIIISAHGKTAYHIINDRKPSIKHLHIFGCICYITKDGENLDKMKEKEDPCVMFRPRTTTTEIVLVKNVSSRPRSSRKQKASRLYNSDPVPPRQNVVPPAEKTDSSQ
ncbi:retrovirus-related pol polyprotein from transposon TNT 1-94 [Tanacetum coccineum]